MKTLKNKNIVRLLILISLIVVVGISFIVTTAVYKGTHIGSGSLVLDKGIYIDISDVSSGELSKNMEMPIQYYLDKVTSETNRVQFSVKPSSESEYYIANPTITAQESSQAFYLRLKLNAQYYVNGSSTPTTFSMSASEKNTLFQLFATDSNYSPVLFNDCFAADANGEYYYYVSGGYGVATKNNLAQVTSGMEISLFKGFLANGTTPVSVINFREFEKVPENVTNITLSLDIELAIEPNNWNLPDVTLLTENDVTVSLVDNEYEITKINTSATSYALPGYYQGNAITRIGTTSPSALDDDAITVWFANTMTHIGGYATSKIQKFYLGNNVTEICEWAFYGTHELSGNLVLPISITKIGDDSFGDSTTISCLFPYLPNCEYFGSGSFKGDSGFYGILSVRGVIGSTAFANVSVRTLNIEAGTTSIGTDSFYGMQGLRRVFIDSSAIAGLASSDSCLLDISNNVSLQDVYIKDGLTIGAYFTSDSNFVETESNVAGYRHFGRSYQLTFNGGNIDGTLDAKLWNYAGSAGYSSSNTGNNGKYSFSGKNATTKIGINGVNTFYLPMPIISGYTFDGWYTTANGSSETVKVATADGWIANVSGYTSENGSWIRASATTLYAHYTKKEYSISYDFAGGSKGTNAPSSYIFGNTTAISNPTRAGYTFVGWNISVSLTGKSLATIDINTGVQEYVASYPDAVYYELFYAHKDISYTAALSGGQIRWRKYTTAGAFGGNVSTSSQYAPTDNMYVALWYHLGKKDNNTIYTYNYIGDNLSIDSLQVGNLTLTAKWKPITYTIQYNGNGNTSGSTASSSHTYDQAKALTANGFVKTGYTFEGWATSATGEVVYNNKQSVINLSSTQGAKITLYAQWRVNVLTIRYHLNGGTSVSGNSYFSSGNPCRTENWGYTSSSQYGLTNYDDTKRVARTGYLANTYYNTKANGSGNNLDHDSLTTTKQIATAAGVLTNLENGDTTIDIYMIWTPITYTIKYNGNGNTSGSTANSSHTYDQAKALTANGFVKTGYTFAGWATSKTGAVVYTNKQSVKNLSSTQGDTVTLYAKWTPITYTIKYDGNGNTGGSTANSSHTYDQAKALTANSFSKTGYTFAGWATSKTGAVVYTNKQTVTNLSSTQGDTITLYAKWTANTYTVTYEWSLTDKGWMDQNINHSPRFTNWSVSGTTLNVSITGQGGWEAKWLCFYGEAGHQYTWTFGYTMPASCGMRVQILNSQPGNNNGQSAQVNTVSGSGYLDLAKGATGTATLNFTPSTTGNYYLNLNFGYLTDNVAMNLSFTNIKLQTTRKVTYDSTYSSMPTTRNSWVTGYNNLKWTNSSGTTITSSTKVATASNHTLSANLDAVERVITFDSMLPVPWKYLYLNSNTNGTFVANSADEYVFTHNSSKDPSKSAGPHIQNLQTYMTNGERYRITVSIKSSAAITLPMRFEASSSSKNISVTTSYQTFYLDFTYDNTTTWHSFTFYSSSWVNGQTMTFKDLKLSRLATVNSAYDTLPSPTKEGYTFDGWWTTSDNSGIQITKDSICVTYNRNLYAHWTPITYTISYNGNGSTSGSTASSSHTYDQAQDLTANGFGKTGYTFIGWATSATGEVVYNDQQSVENLTSTQGATITLYAKWTPNEYTVSFNPNEKGGLLTDVANGTYSGNNATITYTSSSHQYKFVNSSTNDPYVTIASTVYLVAGKTYTIHAKMSNTSGSVISGSIQIFYAINKNYSEANSKRLSGGEGSTTLTVSSTGTYNIRIDNDFGKDIVIYEFYIIEGNFTTRKTVTYDSTYGDLPTPLREGYTFAGWYTASSGGTKVESSTKVKITANQTLYAHWRENNIAYLMTGWQEKLKAANSNYTQANIESIEFTNTKPTSGTRVSVGAIYSDGTTAYVSGTSNLSDVIAYVTAGSTSGKYKVVFYSNATIYAPQDSSYLFSSSSNSKLTSLTSIKFDNFNTMLVTTMRSMFMGCSALTSINLTNFNTSNVTVMWSMFEGCSNLSSLDLRSFNTAKVTDMDSMFKNCSNLSSVYTSSFITTNVKYMTDMFASTNLSSLDLSNFDMSKVVNVSGMLSFSTSQFNFYELITPKKMAVAIGLPFRFCKASDYSGDYASIPTSLTSTKLLTKYVQVYRYDEGTWEKCSLSTSISGFNHGDTISVARGTYIDIYLNAKGYALERSWVRAVFYGLLSKPSLVSGPSGAYASWRFKDGDNNNVNSLLANEDLSLGIIDERTNVEEIELGDSSMFDINKEDEIMPTWATATGRYYCLLECQQTVAMKCNATIRIRAESNFTSIYGLGGKGSPLRLPW